MNCVWSSFEYRTDTYNLTERYTHLQHEIRQERDIPKIEFRKVAFHFKHYGICYTLANIQNLDFIRRKQANDTT